MSDPSAAMSMGDAAINPAAMSPTLRSATRAPISPVERDRDRAEGRADDLVSVLGVEADLIGHGEQRRPQRREVGRRYRLPEPVEGVGIDVALAVRERLGLQLVPDRIEPEGVGRKGEHVDDADRESDQAHAGQRDRELSGPRRR